MYLNDYGHSYAQVVPRADFHFLVVVFIIMVSIMTVAAPVLPRKSKRDRRAMVRYYDVAQWVERGFCNRRVGGSIPTSTKLMSMITGIPMHKYFLAWNSIF